MLMHAHFIFALFRPSQDIVCFVQFSTTQLFILFYDRHVLPSLRLCFSTFANNAIAIRIVEFYDEITNFS